MSKRRRMYIILIVAAAFIGISSRLAPEFYSDWLQPHLGDAAWALAAYAVFGFLFPSMAIWKKLIIAFGFSCLVEISQLFDYWILTLIRETQAGKWLIGTSFLWIDFLRYAAGTGLGALIEFISVKD
ncbi:MAG: DUF2809 domain-containing protein [Bacteroidales bacterium]|nr:DUF2809 domain-containing protein [Bacteroidales bacterium]